MNADLVGQRDKWVKKGSSAVPDSYTVTTTLTTAGSGTGTVFKDSGIVSGTVVSIGDKEVILNIGF